MVNNEKEVENGASR